jgi:two-component system OmpR family response regulator
MRILVVEDDDRSASYLVRGLRESGYVVDRAADGELGLSLARELIFDLLIVDRLLPSLDGLELVRTLRQAGIAVPVLMLSALASPQDRIEGLRDGCDDYLAKPYAFAELLARIEAIARRLKMPLGNTTMSAAGLTLDIPQRVATREGQAIVLQQREVLLLQTLMRNAGNVVTRSMLLEAAWDYDFEPRGNIVDMHIHRIRKKIDGGFATSLIHTVPGAGYVFTDDPQADPAT